LTLIYNRREREERSEFVKIIESNVRDRNRKEEIEQMGKTIAQELIEEGKLIGKELGKELGTITAKQDALIRLLKVRFGTASETLVEKIRSIKQVDQLDELFDRAIVAGKLDDVGI